MSSGSTPYGFPYEAGTPSTFLSNVKARDDKMVELVELMLDPRKQLPEGRRQMNCSYPSHEYRRY